MKINKVLETLNIALEQRDLDIWLKEQTIKEQKEQIKRLAELNDDVIKNLEQAKKEIEQLKQDLDFYKPKSEDKADV